MFLLVAHFAAPLSAQTAPDALPALAPAYPELPPTFWELHQSTLIVAGFALLAFAFLLLKTMLRPAKAVILPPETVARQALAKLQVEPEDGTVLSAVSQVLRRYVSEALNLPNSERTTGEFCAVIAGTQSIGSDLAEALASFLRECDVRKFSPSGGPASANAVCRALEFINQVEQRRERMRETKAGST